LIRGACGTHADGAQQRDPQGKLETRAHERKGRSEHTAWRLYDLTQDIGEQKDVAKQHGDVVKELGAHFDKWRSSMHPTVE